MKKTTIFLIVLPLSIIGLFSVGFGVFHFKKGGDLSSEDHSEEPDSSAIFSGRDQVATLVPSANLAIRSVPKPATKIEEAAYAVRRIDPAKWEQVRKAHQLSITPKRLFIVNPIPVEINLAPLQAAREKAVTRIQLDLGLDEPVIAEVGDRFEHGAEAYSLAGKMEGDPTSEYSISVYRDAVVGTFYSDRFGIRQLRYVGQGVHRVETIRDELSPRCGIDREQPLPPRSSREIGVPRVAPINGIRPGEEGLFDSVGLGESGKAKAGGAKDAGDPTDPVELDVLVAYTQNAVDGEGSLNALLALINQGFVDTNLAFQNSNIDGVLRLVGTHQVTYSGTTGGAALSAIRGTSDGAMDEIHTLRNSFGADFVSLWTNVSDVCGIASLIRTLNVNQAHRAFSVVDPDCQYKFTFSHELGHNWGLMHAVGDSGATRGQGIYDYSHGWRWNGTNGTQYRSMLAYSPGSRIRQYSDPGVSYEGGASGRSGLEDNALAIEQIMGVMSQFRTTSGDDHGDTITSATAIPTSSSTFGNLEDPDDLDVFGFSLNGNATITVETTGVVDTGGRLLSSSGVELVSDSSSGSGENFSMTANLSAGTYFVEVSSESNASGVYSVVLSGGGGDDHGNDISTATSLPVPGIMNGVFEEGGDEDFFRLNVPVSGTIDIFTTGSTDSFGYLLNGSGSILQSDDDDGTGTNFLISYSVSPGIHYVRVRGFSAGTTGAYTLNVNLEEVPDDHANTFTEATVVPVGSVSSPTSVAGEFEFPGDVDVLRFTLYGSVSDQADVLALSFDSSAPTPGNEVTIASRNENGFSVAGASGTDLWHVGSDYSAGGNFLSDNGTPNFKILPNDVFEVAKADGSEFSAFFIDLAEWSETSNSAKSILFTGHKADGSTVTHTFVTDGIVDGPGGEPDFETMIFPFTFRNIVKLASASTIFALDNIVLDDPSGIRLDMEGAPVIGSGGQVEITSYVEDGFRIQPLPGGSLSRSRSGNVSSPDNGGSYLHLLTGDTLEMVSQNGTLFDVLQVDLSEYSTAFQNPQSITWKGYRPDGTVLTHTFVTDGMIDGFEGEADFESFIFPPEFVGLIKLETISSPCAVDNVVANFSSDPIPTGTLQIESFGSTDTQATLYNSQLQVLRTDNNSGSDSNFLISEADFPIGTYYLRVNEFADNDTGAYSVQIGYGLEVGAPPAPLSFTASQDNSNAVVLAWDEPPTATSYQVHRNTVDDFSSATVLASGISESSFSDTSATIGLSYYYWVTAINSGGESPESVSAVGLRDIPGPEITGQPADAVVPAGQSVVLSSSATTTSGTLSYQWYEGAAGDISIPVGTDSASYVVSSVTGPEDYWVRISNGFNHTDSRSATVSVELVASPLVTASRGLSASSILLRWLPVPGASSYAIYRNTSDDSETAVKVGTTGALQFDDATGVVGQTYYYFVRAINSSGAEGVNSGGDSHHGNLSATPLDGSLLPVEGIVDFTYSPHGSHLFLAGDSGWLDRYSISGKTIDSWAGIGEALLGIDSNDQGDHVIAVAEQSSGGNALVFEVDFTSGIPVATSHQAPLESGESGFFDVQFASDDLVLLTSRTSLATVPLRDLNLSTGVFRSRPDLLTASGDVASETFFAAAPRSYSRSGAPGAILYQNDFEEGAASLAGYTIGDMGTGEVAVENGVLRLSPGQGYLDRAFVALRLQDVLPSFDPTLSSNGGKLTWAFTLSNQDGSSNNQFGFALANLPDPGDAENFYYELAGGLSGDSLQFNRNALADSPFGPDFSSLLTHSGGLTTNSEGAFRITLEPSIGEWKFYFEQGPVPVDPLTVDTLIGTVTNHQFTSASLPYFLFRSQFTGATFIDRFSFAMEGGGGLPVANPAPGPLGVKVVQSAPAAAGWFDYDLAGDSFGTELAHAATTQFAATSPHRDWVAVGDVGGTTIYDPAGVEETRLAVSGGLGFSPRAYQLYLADASSDQIRVFSTVSWQEIASIPIPGGLAPGSGPFGQGKMEVRPDGLELALSCEDGIRFFDLSNLVSGATLEVSPEPLSDLIGEVGQSNEGISTAFLLSNPGSTPMDWSVAEDADWLEISPSSGVLEAGASIQLNATLTAAVDSLPEDSAETTVTFADSATGRYRKLIQKVRLLTIAPLPIYEDFENPLESHWSITGTGTARAERSSEHEPLRGASHFVMDSSADDSWARNELTLTVDLEGASGVELRLVAREFGDEAHAAPSSPFSGGADFDGVAISDDGVSWYSVMAFPADFSEGADFLIDLDSAIASLGLNYGPVFWIRINQYDGNPAPVAGIAIDNVELTTTADRAAAPGDIHVESLTALEIINESEYDFGLVDETATVDLSVVIRNTGSGVLGNLDSSISGSPDFIQLELPFSRLFPGESSNVTIRLDPSRLGEHLGKCQISSDDPDENPYSFDLRGVAYYPLTTWRQIHFGTTSDTGDAANTFDKWGSGINNLTSFALGLDPNAINRYPLQIDSVTDSTISATYTRSESGSIAGITYTAQWSDQLTEDSWSSAGVNQTMIDSSNGIETVRVTVPTDGRACRGLRIIIDP